MVLSPRTRRLSEAAPASARQPRPAPGPQKRIRGGERKELGEFEGMKKRPPAFSIHRPRGSWNSGFPGPEGLPGGDRIARGRASICGPRLAMASGRLDHRRILIFTAARRSPAHRGGSTNFAAGTSEERPNRTTVSICTPAGGRFQRPQLQKAATPAIWKARSARPSSPVAGLRNPAFIPATPKGGANPQEKCSDGGARRIARSSNMRSEGGARRQGGGSKQMIFVTGRVQRGPARGFM